MGKIRLIGIFLLMSLLVLSTMVSAKTLYYEDENLGVISVDLKTTLVAKMLNLLQIQALSITTEQKSIKVGEELNIKVITEVPCEDRSGKVLKDTDISVAKFVVTDPALSTTNFDIKTGGIIGDLKVCQTNQFDMTIVPKKEGKYTVHYVVMQKVYPQILVKEINEFTAVKVISAPKVIPIEDKIPEVVPEVIIVPEVVMIPENKLEVSGCTEDLVQLCADGSKIVAYSCKSGVLTPTEEHCKEGDEGAQGEIPLLTRLFSPDFYGIYSYLIVGLIMATVLLVVGTPRKRGRK